MVCCGVLWCVVVCCGVLWCVVRTRYCTVVACVRYFGEGVVVCGVGVVYVVVVCFVV